MDICILVTGEEGVGKTELIDSFAKSSIIVSWFFITFMELWDFITIFFQDETETGICRLRVKNTLVTFHIEESLFCFKNWMLAIFQKLFSEPWLSRTNLWLNTIKHNFPNKYKQQTFSTKGDQLGWLFQQKFREYKIQYHLALFWHHQSLITWFFTDQVIRELQSFLW